MRLLDARPISRLIGAVKRPGYLRSGSKADSKRDLRRHWAGLREIGYGPGRPWPVARTMTRYLGRWQERSYVRWPTRTFPHWGGLPPHSARTRPAPRGSSLEGTSCPP
jgi:hypothetical protein